MPSAVGVRIERGEAGLRLEAADLVQPRLERRQPLGLDRGLSMKLA